MFETFTSHNPLPEMYELYELARKDPKNRLPQNYTEDRAFTHDTLLYSVTLEDGRPILGSSLIMKDFYNKSARALNRLYLVPGTSAMMPRKLVHKLYPPIAEQLRQQVEKAKSHNITDIFISRDDKHTGRMNRLIYAFNHNTPYDWTLTDEEYWTCKDKCQECSQRIFYINNLTLTRNEDVVF
jgi:hypothetical protein